MSEYRTKKFTAGEQNLAKKYNLDLTKKDEPRTIEVMNRFGFGSVMVNALEKKTYQASIAIYEAYEYGRPANISEADRLKYLLLSLNSEAYSTLLD